MSEEQYLAQNNGISLRENEDESHACPWLRFQKGPAHVYHEPEWGREYTLLVRRSHGRAETGRTIGKTRRTTHTISQRKIVTKGRRHSVVIKGLRMSATDLGGAGSSFLMELTARTAVSARKTCVVGVLHLPHGLGARVLCYLRLSSRR